MEFAIRTFLKNFPEKTMEYIQIWSKNENYHVRRLASEGIRPNLPW
jgi:3-methyladenine DNA glycosylase AlkC|tara:strand:- start:1605 stop:1742 length:138 start_codon:yes stop_codon:yes gene_type:complete